jgi:ADP-dependent NAD(P)H-hydrate dehydratase / NAD(P)H-hydrate epimerase
MKRVSAKEIQRIDQQATQDCSIPSILLMENAGRSVSDVIRREYKPCKVVIFIGKGNNGGDGLVVARHLTNHGYSVQVALLENPLKLKIDPLLNFSIVKKMKIPWALMESDSDELISSHCKNSDFIVDAIFGVGIHGRVGGIFEKAIRAINESHKPVVSVDIPSGMDADTGQVLGLAVKAAMTVTLTLPKHGLFEGEGPRFSGVIEVVDSGIPHDLIAPFLS